MKKGLLSLLLLAIYVPIALHAQVRVTNFTPSMVGESIQVLHDTVVNCDEYTWKDGIKYTESTENVGYIMRNVADDADSVIFVLHLTIKHTVHHYDTVMTCTTPYVWNGQNITKSGDDYTANLTAANDCDSIDHLKITFTSELTGSETVIACPPFTWIDGNTYINDTVAYDTIRSAGGCDSIVTLNYTAATLATDSVVTCSASYSWNGEEYTENGIIEYRKINDGGCDTLYRLNLTLNTTPENNIYETVNGEYVWENDTIRATDQRIDTILSRTVSARDGSVTCDTLYNYHVAILPIYTIDTAFCSIRANSSYAGFAWPVYGRGMKIWLKTTGDTLYICKGNDGSDSCCMKIHYEDLYTDTTFLEPLSVCGEYIWLDGTRYTDSQDSLLFRATNVNGCDSIVVLPKLTIMELPSFHIAGTFSVHPGNSTELYAVSDETLSYVWSTGETTDTITVTPSENTEYSLTATNAQECSKTSSVTIVVSEEGISAANASNVRIYPNPAATQVIIEGSSVSNIKIYNMLGQLVVNKDASNNKTVIPLEDYNNGSYILRIETKDGKTNVRSLVIKK